MGSKKGKMTAQEAGRRGRTNGGPRDRELIEERKELEEE